MSKVSVEIRVSGEVYLDLETDEFDGLDSDQMAEAIADMADSACDVVQADTNDVFDAVEAVKNALDM